MRVFFFLVRAREGERERERERDRQRGLECGLWFWGRFVFEKYGWESGSEIPRYVQFSV